MFAIICDARAGESLGIDVLALVDRAKSRRRWWTSDDASIALAYEKRTAADFAARRLRRNNVHVVPFSVAARQLNRQASAIDHHEAMTSLEEGWDGHKDER